MSVAIDLILCNVATMAIGIMTIVYSIRLWRLRSIRWLLVLTISFLVSSLCTVNVYIAQNFSDKMIFFQLRILGMAFFPPAWLYFISSVCDRWKWLHKKWTTAIFLTPSLFNFFLVLFPQTRGLFYSDFKPFVFQDITVVQYTNGPAYALVYDWSMLLLLASYAVSIVACIKERGFRRRQVLILNFGFSAALFIYFFVDAETVKWVVGSSVSILFTQMGIMYAVIRYRLFSIIPLAIARIFEQFPDPILVLDDEGRVMGASDKAVSFFALPAQFLGQSIEKLLPTVPRSPGEVAIADANGKAYHFHLAVEKMAIEQGSSPGTVLFFRDIKEQKSVEMRLHEGLEFRARLLAFFAHDLMGFTESQAVMSLALQKKIPQEHHHQLNLLTSSARTSQELVSNIMTWVKTQSLQFEPLRQPFEWNTLLREILEQMDGRLNQKGIKVVFTPTRKPLISEGDSEMLAAVFRNILSNSVRATDAGKAIHIRIDELAEKVVVAVRDEGSGIEPSELERILEKTQSFQLSGVSKTQGAGLGLMIARHFIFLHKGQLDLNSQLGVGTEVLVSIPL